MSPAARAALALAGLLALAAQALRAQPTEGLLDCAPPDRVAQVLAAVNARRAAGAHCGDRDWPPVAALAWSEPVAAAAAAHAADSARHDQMDHRGSDGSQADRRLERAGLRWRAWAENLGRGHDDIDALVLHWSQSAVHCANLMHPRMSLLGLACRQRAGHERFWVLTLAAPQ